jgi:hypothetical protein
VSVPCQLPLASCAQASGRQASKAIMAALADMILIMAFVFMRGDFASATKQYVRLAFVHGWPGSN